MRGVAFLLEVNVISLFLLLFDVWFLWNSNGMKTHKNHNHLQLPNPQPPKLHQSTFGF
jgi:hypothetical protein